MSPIERMLYANNTNEISILINELGLSNIDVNEYVKNASYLELSSLNNLAQNFGYSPEILYVFYQTAMGSGRLLIFMGVGAMTDFGPIEQKH